MFAFLLVFGVLFCSNVAFELEQSCSKFHYEELTLEKIIRLQIFVEKIKEEVDSTQLKVMDELKALTKQREQFQREIQETKDDLERTKADMEEDLSTTKMKHFDAITKYADDIAKIKESTLVPPVAFQSHIASDKIMADNKVIVFSTDMLNYNGSYDNTTGTFIVPLDGIYMFSVQLYLPSLSYSYYGIYVNEAFVQHGRLGDNGRYNTFTLVAVADVAKGDRVTVRCISSCGGDNLHEHSLSSSSFSGVLIHRK